MEYFPLDQLTSFLKSLNKFGLQYLCFALVTEKNTAPYSLVFIILSYKTVFDSIKYLSDKM